MAYLWIALAALVFFVGLAYRIRLREEVRRRAPPLSDDQIRRIEATGRLDLDAEEPLDLDEIDRAEEEFWEESWDEPEEW